ncbi:MAG: hypothetical protein AABX83_02805 [Nanoarchaeota archaeon]
MARELRLYEVYGEVQYKDGHERIYEDIVPARSKREVKSDLDKKMKKSKIRLNYLEITEVEIPGYKISISPLENKV